MEYSLFLLCFNMQRISLTECRRLLQRMESIAGPFNLQNPRARVDLQLCVVRLYSLVRATDFFF